MSAPLDILPIPGGPLETNAYLVIDPPSRSGILVDAPPETSDAIVARVRDAGVTVDRIVLTHTHWDHIIDTAALREALGARILAHSDADAHLATPGSVGMALPYSVAPIVPDGHLADGDTVSLGDHAFSVLHLPGHDPSHIALLSVDDRVLLGGDVLFPGGHGRTDLPGADQATMVQSLARLLPLPDDTTVYPGHGQATTIGAERDWMTRMTDPA